jgi:predicted ester cyclase
LSKVLQRYCFAYTATHDFTVADQVMVDDYTFYMGEYVFSGRESAYKPAADRQFKAYPGLGFTVHDFFSNGERCAMFFSEHGHSAQYDVDTAWHGVSLYRWNGEKLTECRIEQDYYGRRRQLESKSADPIAQPAYAPWTRPVEPSSSASEALVTDWLTNGGLLRSQIGSLDDERIAPTIDRVIFADERCEIRDIMSAGNRVAFQVRIDGIYAGGMRTLDGHQGVQASLYATGIVDLDGDTISKVRSVTDRYSMERRILAAAKR